MGGNTSTLLVYFGLLAVAFYFLIIRPQQQRQRQQRDLMSALKVGDRVMTASGIFGTVQSMDADAVTLRIAEGVDVEFARAAVSQIVESFSAGPSPEEPLDE
jgi:preprotein translocase subunit YajC